jgi:lysophospholipid acyltransferase (LPLAT)-like uncharacterized protein
MPEAAQVHEATFWQRLVAAAASVVLRAWLGTLRLQAPPEAARHLGVEGAPRMVLLWHNQLLLAPFCNWRLRGGAPSAGLVSASKDGALLSALFNELGIRVIRGSSSRLGREALHGLVQRLRAGIDVAVTPDGPRGPAYSFEEGALVAARRAGVPVVLLGFELERAWRVDSWDGFFLPRPFSVVRVRTEKVEAADLADRAAAATELRRRLQALSAVNEVRFPAPPRMLRRLASDT